MQGAHGDQARRGCPAVPEVREGRRVDVRALEIRGRPRPWDGVDAGQDGLVTSLIADPPSGFARSSKLRRSCGGGALRRARAILEWTREPPRPCAGAQFSPVALSARDALGAEPPPRRGSEPRRRSWHRRTPRRASRVGAHQPSTTRAGHGCVPARGGCSDGRACAWKPRRGLLPTQPLAVFFLYRSNGRMGSTPDREIPRLVCLVPPGGSAAGRSHGRREA